MRFSTRINQAYTSHIAVGYLVTAKVNRMFGSQFGIHTFVDLSETNGFEATIISRKFLFHNVSFDSHSQAVGLTCQVGGSMVIDCTFLKIIVTQVTPEDGCHTQFVSIFKSFGNLYQLTATLFRAKINSSSYGHRSHIPGFFDSAKQHLVEAIRIREQFIVVQFHNEGYLMRIFTCYGSKNSKRGSYSVTTAFNSQFHNIFRIEIDRIGSK